MKEEQVNEALAKIAKSIADLNNMITAIQLDIKPAEVKLEVKPEVGQVWMMNDRKCYIIDISDTAIKYLYFNVLNFPTVATVFKEYFIKEHTYIPGYKLEFVNKKEPDSELNHNSFSEGY